MEFCKWMEGQSKIVKVLLAIPALDIIWGIYRLVKAILSKDTASIVIAILILAIGWSFWWIVDMVFIILTDKVPFVK